MNNLRIFKFIATTLLLLILFFSCEKDNRNLTVSGELANVEGDHFIAAFEKGDSIIIDTIKIQDGKFSYKAYVDTLTIMRLYFNNNKNPRLFAFVDKNWDVKIKGDIFYPDLINIEGGDINNDITEFKKQNKELLLEQARIMNSVGKDSSSTNDNKDYIMNLKNINFELANATGEYVKKNPNKIASVVLMNVFFKDETLIPRLDEALNKLTGKAELFYLTQELRDFSQKTKKVQAGTYAPSFSLETTKGAKKNLADYREKFLLLSFESTDCKSCVQTRPEVIKIYNSIKSDRKLKNEINFVSIVIDSEKKPLEKATRDSIKWDIFLEDGSWASKTFRQYNINEVPYFILISPSGTILERNLPIDALPAKLEVFTSNSKK